MSARQYIKYYLGNTKNISLTLTAADNQSVDLYSVMSDCYTNYYITSNRGVFVVNTDLTSQILDTTTSYNKKTIMALDYNNVITFHDGVSSAVYTADNILYVVRDGFLCQGVTPLTTMMPELQEACCCNVDPDGYVWLIHHQNRLSKLSITDSLIEVIKTVQIGSVDIPGENNTRQISFVYRQDKSTLTNTWNLVVYNATDSHLHFITPDLFLEESVNLVFRVSSPSELTVKKDLLLCASSCPTGYVVSNVSSSFLYNKRSNLVFKCSMRNIVTDFFKTFDIYVNTDKLVSNQWHHIVVTYQDNLLLMFVDGAPVGRSVIPSGYIIDNSYSGSLLIGTTSGRNFSLNEDLRINDIYYNGCIDDVRIYNYCLAPNLLSIFRRSYVVAQDIAWNIPTPPIQYIEGIERMFMNKIPGNKSQFYKLRITGFNLDLKDEQETLYVRSLLEQYIADAVQQTQPLHLELLGIEWV